MEVENEAQLKVSAHDRVSSMIVAMLYLVGFAAFLLFMLWATTRKSGATSQIEVTYIDELPGGDPAFSDGRDFEEPSVEDMQDLASSDSDSILQAITDVASNVSAGAKVPAGNTNETRSGERRRAGRSGDASVPRWERWELRYSTTSLNDYAKQLESFGIELGAVGGGRTEIDYASKLDAAKPVVRKGPTEDETRMYMSHQSGQLKAFDRQLLNRAGINTTGRLTLQFYPRNVEGQLASLELAKAGGRPLKDIRKTVFSVQPSGGGYRFEVSEQRFR